MARTILKGARLIDGLGGGPVEDATVVIEEGRIAEVGAGAASASGETIDLGGAAVLPGIVNGTDYLTMKEVTQSQSYYDIYRQSSHLQLLRAARSALVLLTQGVTTTVDIGAIERVNLHLRNGIDMGLVVGPRIVTSATPIEPRLATEGVKTPGMTVDAQDAAEVRRHAEALVEAGVDFITIKIDRRDFKSGQTRSFTVDEVRAAGAVAKAAGKRLHVLARMPADIRTALEAGASSISPAMHLCREPQLAREMAERGVTFITSVSSWPRGTFASPERDREHRESLRLMLEAGVHVVPGIDLYGVDPVDELALLVEMGVRPGDAIVSATRGGAAMLGLEGELGTIEPGKRADLVVVEGDPTRDVRALERVRFTFAAGRRYVPAELEGAIGSSTSIQEPAVAAASAR